MSEFVTTLITVSIMLVCAVPGFMLIKAKAVRAESIPAFSKVLLYVCQPALTFYSFNKADFTKSLGINMLLFFAVITVIQLIFLGTFFLIFRRRSDDVRYRIATVATVLSNCSFFGVPLLEAIFPESNTVAVYSMTYGLSMNIIGWTVVSAIITKNKKFVSVKKLVLNPATLSFAVALPFFLCGFKIDGSHGEFCEQLNNIISIIGKMTLPVCMLIMGMRLATVKFGSIFIDWLRYLSIAVNQVVFPLVVLGVTMLLRLDKEIVFGMFIMSACPVASVVQNYSEILGKGQDAAANTVLLGTILSVITLPLLALIL